MGAAALTLTGTLKGNLHVMPMGLRDRIITKSIYIDTTLTGLTLSNAAYKILHLEADTLVLGGWVITDVAEGAAETMDVGDTTAENTWLNNVSLNTDNTATEFTGAAKYYAAADEIQITPSAAQGTSKFWVVVRLIQLSKV
jgi:hypothetical protein